MAHLGYYFTDGGNIVESTKPENAEVLKGEILKLTLHKNICPYCL